MKRLPRRESVTELSWRMVSKSQRRRDETEGRKAIFTHDAVSLSILRFGFYELEYLEALKKIIATNIPSRQVFVDVGAMIGNHSSFLAPLFKLGIAIEPNPASFSLLGMNVPSNVRTVNCAISDDADDVFLCVPRGNVGGASVIDSQPLAGHPHRTLAEDSQFKVRAVGLDDLLTSLRIPPAEVGLIKIDVEGHEAKVVAGSRSVLERGAPLLALESWRGSDQARLFDLLESSGYRYFYDLQVARPWTTPTSLASTIRVTLRALESMILGIPSPVAQISPVSAQAIPRDFAMLLASKTPLDTA